MDQAPSTFLGREPLHSYSRSTATTLHCLLSILTNLMRFETCAYRTGKLVTEVWMRFVAHKLRYKRRESTTDGVSTLTCALFLPNAKKTHTIIKLACTFQTTLVCAFSDDHALCVPFATITLVRTVSNDQACVHLPDHTYVHLSNHHACVYQS